MRRLAVLVLATLTAAALPGCGPKRPPNLSGATPRGGIDSSGTADTRDDTSRTGVDSGPDTRPLDASGLSGEEIPSTMDATTEGGPLDDIYFDYDQEQLREDARATLQQNAQWLRSRTGTKVRIEGNADDRGTIEYNLALGQRRADAVRAYLASLGVNTADVEVISYGEEKPAVDGTDESSWAQNRRADFVIVPKP